MKEHTTGGIYLIECLANGCQYIGSSWRMTVRFAEHQQDLAERNHDSPALQADWDTHGASAFRFSILEHAGIDRRKREQALMDAARERGVTLYNRRRAYNPNNTKSKFATTARKWIRSEDREPITPEEARERQVQGARITNAIRRNKTHKAITEAITALTSQGVTHPTQGQVAQVAGVSRRTVNAHMRNG